MSEIEILEIQLKDLKNAIDNIISAINRNLRRGLCYDIKGYK